MTREDLHTSAKIGVFGIGLAAYWPQFEGLRSGWRAIRPTWNNR